ncbi:hypothetical protein KP509_03G022300 [Ceratopteris richardii]|nr:hypothetical protein KP509_03G022300 [Ceratopteris richardii]
MHASAIFFSPASLAVGRALQLPNISNDLQSLKLLPQSISQALPKLKQGNLLKLTGLFGVQKGSSMELEMENTLAHCSYKSEHEIRACVTSGEDMVSFITKAMGSKLTVYSTPLSVMESATVVDIVKVASRGRKVASCHNMKFPSLLFSCHMSATSELMQVSLKSTDGHTTTRPAICHMDTSYWNPSHIAFQVLNLEPGKGSVCHWFPENSFIFVES